MSKRKHSANANGVGKATSEATLPPATGSAIGPFQVYEDYEDGLHIIDGNTRVMLSDSYAYDGNDAERMARMEWTAQALTDAWQAEQTGDNMPISPNSVLYDKSAKSTNANALDKET